MHSTLKEHHKKVAWNSMEMPDKRESANMEGHF